MIACLFFPVCFIIYLCWPKEWPWEDFSYKKEEKDGIQ